MMALVEAPDNLGVLVGRGVRVFLASQRDADSCIVLAVLRQLIGLLIRGKLDRGPLAPEVDAGGCIDQFNDIGSAYPRGGFEEIKMALVTPFDEFHVGYAVHLSEGADDLAA